MSDVRTERERLVEDFRHDVERYVGMVVGDSSTGGVACNHLVRLFRIALAAADLLSEEGEPVAWLVVEPGSALKRCPECGAVALEGQADCSECGAHPLDDRSWRIAGRMPRFGHPGPVQEAAP